MLSAEWLETQTLPEPSMAREDGPAMLGAVKPAEGESGTPVLERWVTLFPLRLAIQAQPAPSRARAVG